MACSCCAARAWRGWHNGDVACVLLADAFGALLVPGLSHPGCRTAPRMEPAPGPEERVAAGAFCVCSSDPPAPAGSSPGRSAAFSFLYGLLALLSRLLLRSV